MEWAGAERWLSNSRPGGPAATRGLEALAYFLVVRGRLAGGPHGPTGRTAPGRGAARAGASATEGEGPGETRRVAVHTGNDTMSPKKKHTRWQQVPLAVGSGQWVTHQAIDVRGNACR